MKISFHGAARNVTGTKHLITLKDGTKILLDCGMFQGLGPATDDLNNDWGFEPSSISFLLLSHAHIDHSGLIPKLVKDGFTGKIYCTKATRDLTEILLYDSAEIQTYEIEYVNKKRAARKLPPYEPMYAAEHVQQAMQLFEAVDYNVPFKPQENVEVILTNTGHLVGSAAIHLTIQENGKATTIAFSGDVGRYNSLLLQPPADFPQADYIILESTYGDKQHDMVFNTIDTLRKWVTETCIKKQGKLIIPAFSVGRTQEILYALNQLELEKRLPELFYFVDSPLSKKATEVIKENMELFNDKLQEILKMDNDPFHFNGLKYVETVDESKQLVDYKEPCVIISASGTADAGRVRHHINSCISEPNHTVLFVGYCQATSLGGQLLDGVKEVEIFSDPCSVVAEIGSLRSMSAHGDYDDLLRFIGCQDAENVKKVFLVHGEYKVQQDFVPRLQRKGFEQVEIPQQHQEFELE